MTRINNNYLKKKVSKKKSSQEFFQSLRPGDLVDIVAPGWASSEEKVHRAQDFLKSWGLRSRVPEGLFSPRFDGSHEIKHRLRFLVNALRSPDSQAVWCLRGGYGSLHLLPGLRAIKPPAQKKILIGISDITSLHAFLIKKWRWPSLHAPLLERVSGDEINPAHREELRSLLFGELKALFHEDLVPLNKAATKRKKLDGRLLGGNATVFQSLIGTPYMPNLRGSILFFEDIGERAYRIDKVLHHLLQAKELTKVQALLWGEFHGGEEKDGSNPWPELERTWSQRLDGLGIAFFGGLKVGHLWNQRPIPYGLPARLSGGPSPELLIGLTRGILK